MRIVLLNCEPFRWLGWLTNPAHEHHATQSLEALGLETATVDLQTSADIAKLQPLADGQTLFLPNAYYLTEPDASGQPTWLPGLLERYGLPFIGSSAATLKTLLYKAQCHDSLRQAGIGAPDYTAIWANDLPYLTERLAAAGLEFPVFVKCEATASSQGISPANVIDNLPALCQRIAELAEMHAGPMLIEEFLPGQEITTAIFRTEAGLRFCSHVFQTPRLASCGAFGPVMRVIDDWAEGKFLRPVTDSAVLAQMPEHVQRICNRLAIGDVTRIDSRLDRHGQLKCFDVNGYPGLSFPQSVLVDQVVTQLGSVGNSPQDAYAWLLAAIVQAAALRNGLPCPVSIRERVRTSEAALTYLAPATSGSRSLGSTVSAR